MADSTGAVSLTEAQLQSMITTIFGDVNTRISNATNKASGVVAADYGAFINGFALKAGNDGVKSSTAAIKFTAAKAGILRFFYAAGEETNYDYLIVEKNDTQVLSTKGKTSPYGGCYEVTLVVGDTIAFKRIEDSSNFYNGDYVIIGNFSFGTTNAAFDPINSASDLYKVLTPVLTGDTYGWTQGYAFSGGSITVDTTGKITSAHNCVPQFLDYRTLANTFMGAKLKNFCDIMSRPGWGDITYDAFAIGINSYASTASSYAIGTNAYAMDEAVAIGHGSNATTYSIAIGNNSKTTYNYAVAIGESACASGQMAFALGYFANARTHSTLAIGKYVDAIGQFSMAIGCNVSAMLYGSLALGVNVNTCGCYSLAAGYALNVTNNYSVSFASSSLVQGCYAATLGYQTNTLGNNDVAMGHSVKVNCDSGIGIGSFISIDAPDSIAIGRSAAVLANIGYSTAIGSTTTSGNYGTAIGSYAHANGNFAVAVGYNANTSTALRSVAIGYNAFACGTNGVAVGYNSSAISMNATAIGCGANAGTTYTVSIGANSTAEKTYSTAVGHNAHVSGCYASAFGATSNAIGNYSTAIGYQANTTAAQVNTIMLGNDGTASLKCKVTLSTTSDERDKADIIDIDDGAVEFLNRVHAITYVWNGRNMYVDEESLTDEEKFNRMTYGIAGYDKEAHAQGLKKGSRRRIGVKAQEVQEALQAVYGSASYANIVDDNLHDVENIPNGVENQLSVNYSSFIPFLIKAIQELDKRIKKLELKEN